MFAILQKYDFSSKSQPSTRDILSLPVVCDTAKVRFFKQITTVGKTGASDAMLFAILQKYDFSSKSQPSSITKHSCYCCLRYCKSTIFQANHNKRDVQNFMKRVVCDTAKVRFFKQITTISRYFIDRKALFAILQKYDFSSKSQLGRRGRRLAEGCLRYCKSTIFQANHNIREFLMFLRSVVCDTAKVRFFKQITTRLLRCGEFHVLFAILQKYDFSSKSQHPKTNTSAYMCCLRYCKSTIFQANHNRGNARDTGRYVVCDTAKVRFFKQITTVKR